MSHVPRVYAFGHGNTSSRTPLIILVFGEFGASELATQRIIYIYIFSFEAVDVFADHDQHPCVPEEYHHDA